MDKFPAKYNLPNLGQYKRKLNGSVYIKEIWFIKKLTKENSRLYGFIDEIYQAFKEEITPILHEFLQKIIEKGILFNSF